MSGTKQNLCYFLGIKNLPDIMRIEAESNSDKTIFWFSNSVNTAIAGQGENLWKQICAHNVQIV